MNRAFFLIDLRLLRDDGCSRLFNSFNEFIFAIVFIEANYFVASIGIFFPIFHKFFIEDGAARDLFQIVIDDFKGCRINNKNRTFFLFLKFLSIFFSDFEFHINNSIESLGVFGKMALVEEAFF